MIGQLTQMLKAKGQKLQYDSLHAVVVILVQWSKTHLVVSTFSCLHQMSSMNFFLSHERNVKVNGEGKSQTCQIWFHWLIRADCALFGWSLTFPSSVFLVSGENHKSAVSRLSSFWKLSRKSSVGKNSVCRLTTKKKLPKHAIISTYLTDVELSPDKKAYGNCGRPIASRSHKDTFTIYLAGEDGSQLE